jgi:hypothetical protein
MNPKALPLDPKVFAQATIKTVNKNKLHGMKYPKIDDCEIILLELPRRIKSEGHKMIVVNLLKYRTRATKPPYVASVAIQQMVIAINKY